MSGFFGLRARAWSTILALCLVLALSGCRTHTRSTLVVWTFPGYLDDQTSAEFERVSGIRLEVRGIGDVLNAMNKVRAGEDVDIFMSDFSLLGQLTNYKLIQPLDRANLQHWDDLWPQFRDNADLRAGGDSVWAMPYMFGATGLAVRTDLVPKSAGTTWDILWNPQFQGRVTVNGRLLGVLVVLLDLGIDFDEFVNHHLPEKDAVYQRVMRRAGALRANVLKYWTSGDDVQELITSGQVAGADMWDGPARRLSSSGLPIHFGIPREGGVGWADLWVVNSRSKNLTQIYRFFNYLDEPAVAQRVAQRSGYCRCNRTAMLGLSSPEQQRLVYSDTELARIHHLGRVAPERQLAIDQMIEDIQLGK
jgi:spermidine/putrescine transport system substrate-binding protein